MTINEIITREAQRVEQQLRDRGYDPKTEGVRSGADITFGRCVDGTLCVDLVVSRFPIKEAPWRKS